MTDPITPDPMKIDASDCNIRRLDLGRAESDYARVVRQLIKAQAKDKSATHIARLEVEADKFKADRAKARARMELHVADGHDCSPGNTYVPTAPRIKERDNTPHSPLLAQPPATPGCQGRSWIFDSINPTDHLEAKSHCDTCPVLDWCKTWTQQSFEATNKDGAIEGTWAGRLYGAPAGALRMLREEQMFTDEEARAAHAAHFRGERSSRVKTGERVYQRRMGRLKPSRRIA